MYMQVIGKTRVSLTSVQNHWWNVPFYLTARPGADAIQAEAYSHKCIGAGLWPGNGGYGQTAFYCYAAPVPEGLSDAVLSGHGSFDKELCEFVRNHGFEKFEPASEGSNGGNGGPIQDPNGLSCGSNSLAM